MTAAADERLEEQSLDAEQFSQNDFSVQNNCSQNNFSQNNFSTQNNFSQKNLLTEQLLLRLTETPSHVHITERVLYTEVKRKCSVAKTNLESLLLERLLLHPCVLARAHRRKGSLPRLCGERVLLRVIDTLRLIGFGLPTRPLFSTPDKVFVGNCITRV